MSQHRVINNNTKPLAFSMLTLTLTFLLVAVPVQTIQPRDLWIAINSSAAAEKLEKKICTKVILYNPIVEKYVKGNYSGPNFITINIGGNEFMSNEKLDSVETSMNISINKAINKRLLHCILVVSLVNTTKEAQEMEGLSPVEMQNKKLGYSIEMAKLLQFKTPVNQRILILVRFGESQKDFGKCKKSIYLQYPRRLVPLFEQVLFDFFPYARAVHAVSTEKIVHTRREESNLLWMCDEVVEKMEAEENCKVQTTKTTECKNMLENGDFSVVGLNTSSCKGFSPRIGFKTNIEMLPSRIPLKCNKGRKLRTPYFQYAVGESPGDLHQLPPAKVSFLEQNSLAHLIFLEILPGIAGIIVFLFFLISTCFILYGVIRHIYIDHMLPKRRRILRKLGKLPEDKVRKKFKSKARNSANSRVLSTTEEAKTFVGGNLAAESRPYYMDDLTDQSSEYEPIQVLSFTTPPIKIDPRKNNLPTVPKLDIPGQPFPTLPDPPLQNERESSGGINKQPTLKSVRHPDLSSQSVTSVIGSVASSWAIDKHDIDDEIERGEKVEQNQPQSGKKHLLSPHKPHHATGGGGEGKLTGKGKTVHPETEHKLSPTNNPGHHKKKHVTGQVTKVNEDEIRKESIRHSRDGAENVTHAKPNHKQNVKRRAGSKSQ